MKELLKGIVSIIFLGVKGRDSRIGSSLRQGCGGVQPCNRTAHLSIKQARRIEQDRSNLLIPGLDKTTIGLYSTQGKPATPSHNN
jgi:hypothetical protein